MSVPVQSIETVERSWWENQSSNTREEDARVGRDAKFEISPDAPPATPRSIMIASLNHPVLRLTSPLSVEVQRENEYVMVWHPGIEEIGYGESLSEAIEDFQSTVVELYLSLRRDEERLGTGLAELLELLSSLVEERP